MKTKFVLVGDNQRVKTKITVEIVSEKYELTRGEHVKVREETRKQVHDMLRKDYDVCEIRGAK